MKKSLFIIGAFSICFAFDGIAQKGAVAMVESELDLQQPDMKVAKTKIDAAVLHEKTKDWPKTYIVKSRVYKKLYDDALNNKKLESDFIIDAFEAIKKAEELDIKGDIKGKGKNKYQEDIGKNLELLRFSLYNDGVSTFTSKSYEKSMLAFERVLELDKLPAYVLKKENLVPVDTTTIFNIGLSAYYCKNFEKAIKYTTMAKDLNYSEATPYIILYSTFRESKDTVNMVNILKEGFQKFPQESLFIKDLSIHYIMTNNISEGLDYVDKALAIDPKNANFYFAKGSFLEQKGDFDGAVETYYKAIELQNDPTVAFNSHFNLGAIKYNAAYKLISAADVEKDQKKWEEKRKYAFDQLRLCIPHFEACLALKPKDLSVLKNLSTVCYRIGTYGDKELYKRFEEIEATIKDLQGAN